MIRLIGVVAAASVGYAFRRRIFGKRGGEHNTRKMENSATLDETEEGQPESCKEKGVGFDPAKASTLAFESLTKTHGAADRLLSSQEQEVDAILASSDSQERDHIATLAAKEETDMHSGDTVLDHGATNVMASACETKGLNVGCSSSITEVDSSGRGGNVRRLIASYEVDSMTGSSKASDRVVTERSKSQVAESGGGSGEYGECSGQDVGAPDEDSSRTTHSEGSSRALSREAACLEQRGQSVPNRFVSEAVVQMDWWKVEGDPARKEVEEDDCGLRCFRSGGDNGRSDNAEESEERDVVCVEETPMVASTSGGVLSNPHWPTDIGSCYKCAEFRSRGSESAQIHMASQEDGRVRLEEVLATELLQQEHDALKANTQRQIVELEENWRRKLESERAMLLKQIIELKRAIQDQAAVEAEAYNCDKSITSVWSDEHGLVGEVGSMSEKRLEGGRQTDTGQSGEEQPDYLQRALLLKQRIVLEHAVEEEGHTGTLGCNDEHLGVDEDQSLEDESCTNETQSDEESEFRRRAMLLQQRLDLETEEEVIAEVDANTMAMWDNEHDLVCELGSDQGERLGEESCIIAAQSGCESEFLRRAMVLQQRVQDESATVEVSEGTEADNERETMLWDGEHDLVGGVGSDEEERLGVARRTDKAGSGDLEVLQSAMLSRQRVFESTSEVIAGEEADDRSDAWMWDGDMGSDHVDALQIKQALEVQKLALEEEHRRVLDCMQEENTAVMNRMRQEWEERQSREIEQVRETLHQESENMLVQEVREDPISTMGEVEGAKLQVEEALKAQRLALAAEHRRMVDEIREENLAAVEAERKQWEKARAEWEERLQEEREVSMAESKQELEQALYLQRLVLDEEHLKIVAEARERELVREKELWEEVLGQEIERVRGILQQEWEDRLQEEKAAVKARHEIESSRHLELALEAQRLTLEAEYARMMDQRRDKEGMKWMRKLEMEREALLSMAKKVVAQEREKYRVSLEADWSAKLAEERLHWQQIEHEKDRERRKLEEKLRKESARLELRAANLETKEMQVQRLRNEDDTIRSELVAVRSQLESVQGYSLHGVRSLS